MKCVNGHSIEGAANFCPICGTNSFKDGAFTDQESATAPTTQVPTHQAPRPTPEAPKSKNGKGAIVIAVAVVIAAVIIAVVIATKGGTPLAKKPIVATPKVKPTGPSLNYMQHTSLKDFNKQENLSGSTSNCTYDPKKWVPGYRFTCFIYNSNSTGIGTVVITSTSSATANEYTWNEAFSLI